MKNKQKKSGIMPPNLLDFHYDSAASWQAGAL